MSGKEENALGDYIVPVLTAAVFICGLVKKTDIFGEFTSGAMEGLQTTADIVPPLILLVTAVGMFRASGLPDFLSELMSPLLSAVGFPAECLPLAIIRPVSGSGAAAVFESILRENHPDSFAGRVASVISGSTETTFYTVAVYYGSLKIKNSRHTLAASLSGDITGFLVSAIAVRLFMY